MPRAKNPDKRTKRLSAPANQDELDQYTDACRLVKAEPADTLRKLAAAFSEYVKEHGFFAQPLKLADPPQKKKPGQ